MKKINIYPNKAGVIDAAAIEFNQFVFDCVDYFNREVPYIKASYKTRGYLSVFINVEYDSGEIQQEESIPVYKKNTAVYFCCTNGFLHKKLWKHFRMFYLNRYHPGYLQKSKSDKKLKKKLKNFYY